MVNTWDVYFGSAFAVDGYGFVGRGTVTFHERTVIFDGKKSWSDGAKIGIFLTITIVPYLLFKVALGIIPAFVVVYYFCASKGTSTISRRSIHDVKRKGRTITFRGINPDSGKRVRAIFLAGNVEEGERIEWEFINSENVAIA